MAKQNNTKSNKPNLREMLQGKAQLMFVLGLGLLLLVRLFAFLSESGSAGESIPTPQKISRIPSQITPDSGTYKSVSQMIEPMKDLKDTRYAVLATFNVFDPQLVLKAGELTQQADPFVAQAKTAWRSGNTTQAQQLLDQAMMRMPNHRGALALRKEIQQKESKASDAATSGAQPTSGSQVARPGSSKK